MFMCVCELFVLYVSALHCKICNTGFYFLHNCRCFFESRTCFYGNGGGGGGGGRGVKKNV